jgi:hypothetical protein
MIYRREAPNTPAKRFRSIILNPIGLKVRNKTFYKCHQMSCGRHNGTKVCLRRKKSLYITKFNIWYGVYQKKCSVVSEVSLARRYKTFTGLIRYSNGALSCIPLFSGAYINQILKVCVYQKNPKIYYFSSFKTGTTVPVAYLHINSCFFNIIHTSAIFA